MFFIFSKLLGFLLSPLVWIVGLFLVSFLIKNTQHKKRFCYTAVGLLIFFSNPFIANQAFRAWEGEPVAMSSIGNYDVGIVLTGVAFNRDEAPDRVFFSKGADRVLHVVQLFKAGKIKKVLITGGSSSILWKGLPEAGRLREVMLYSGIPDSAIIVEDKSRNTRENAFFTRQLVDSLKLDSDLLLITSAFHMPRSVGCFKKVGLIVTPYKVDFMIGNTNWNFSEMIPNSESLSKWSILIHECAGWVLYKIAGYQ